MRDWERSRDFIQGGHPLLETDGMTKEHPEPPVRGLCLCAEPEPDWRASLLCTCGRWIPLAQIARIARLS
jgi:hypothetical protein